MSKINILKKEVLKWKIFMTIDSKDVDFKVIYCLVICQTLYVPSR